MSSTTITTTDVIQSILGVEDDSPIVALRNQKPEHIAQLQTYYESIFDPEPASQAELSVQDRALIAIRVASHTGSTDVVDWYTAVATSAGATEQAIRRIRDNSTASTEQSKLGAAIRHADLLTTAPSHAQAASLKSLKDAGFTPAGILSLSQTIAFVSYQLRLIAGLRAFGASS